MDKCSGDTKATLVFGPTTSARAIIIHWCEVFRIACMLQIEYAGCSDGIAKSL
jgi:hypothetical protein